MQELFIDWGGEVKMGCEIVGRRIWTNAPRPFAASCMAG